jgi:hypothetical protein
MPIRRNEGDSLLATLRAKVGMLPAMARGMAPSLASWLVRLERASILSLVVAYAMASGLLAAEWVRAVAHVSGDVDAPAMLEGGALP